MTLPHCSHCVSCLAIPLLFGLLTGCAEEPSAVPSAAQGTQQPAPELDIPPAPAPPLESPAEPEKAPEADPAALPTEAPSPAAPADTPPAEGGTTLPVPEADTPPPATPEPKAPAPADPEPGDPAPAEAEKPAETGKEEAKPPADGEAAAIEPAADSTEFDIVLQSFESKLAAIRIVRRWTDRGLKEAKELVESERPVIATGLSREKADELMEQLEATGALVIMRNSASGRDVASTAPQPESSDTPAAAKTADSATGNSNEAWPQVIDGVPFRTIEAMIAEIKSDEDKAERVYSSRLMMIRGPIEKMETSEEGDFYLYLQGKEPEDFVMAHGFENPAQVQQQFKAGDTITVLGEADVAYGSTVSMANAHAATDEQLRAIIAKASAADKFDVVVQAVGNQENAGSIAYGVSKWSGGTGNEAMARLQKTPLTVVSSVTRETAERARADLLRSSVYQPNPQVLIRPAKKD